MSLKMNSSKLIVRSLNGEKLKRPPFWFMRQAGRYLPEYRKIRQKSKNFLDFCYTPDLAVEVTLQPLRRYKMDAAILFSDILVVPDALGQKVEFIEGKGPLLNPLQSVKDFNLLSSENFHSHLSSVYETISIIKREISSETALIGFSGAPFTLAVYMIEGMGGTDCTRILRWANEMPEDFQILIDLLTEITAEYLVKQVDSGAEIIQIFDSWSGILQKENFCRFSVNPIQKILEKFKKVYPNIPVIVFPRNAGTLTKIFIKETNIDGISLDKSNSLDWIVKNLQPYITVQGNLDNKTLVTGGKKLKMETIKILKKLNNGPFIFNLGHGILPETPPQNVAILSELILGWPDTEFQSL